MFNKRDIPDEADRPAATERSAPAERAAPKSGSSAIIGPSIHVDGTLKGDEDLVIEGNVKGTVELRSNSVTIGPNGRVNADIHAHTIYVDGSMEGSLVATERVVIRKSANISGSITAPRVSLEDGAHFNGSIDMDPETEALKKAFTGQKRPSATAAKPGSESEAAGSTSRPPEASTDQAKPEPKRQHGKD